jgi:hypothetical protein
MGVIRPTYEVFTTPFIARHNHNRHKKAPTVAVRAFDKPVDF